MIYSLKESKKESLLSFENNKFTLYKLPKKSGQLTVKKIQEIQKCTYPFVIEDDIINIGSLKLSSAPQSLPLLAACLERMFRQSGFFHESEKPVAIATINNETVDLFRYSLTIADTQLPLFCITEIVSTENECIIYTPGGRFVIPNNSESNQLIASLNNRLSELRITTTALSTGTCVYHTAKVHVYHDRVSLLNNSKEYQCVTFGSTKLFSCSENTITLYPLAQKPITLELEDEQVSGRIAYFLEKFGMIELTEPVDEDVVLEGYFLSATSFTSFVEFTPISGGPLSEAIAVLYSQRPLKPVYLRDALDRCLNTLPDSIPLLQALAPEINSDIVASFKFTQLHQHNIHEFEDQILAPSTLRAFYNLVTDKRVQNGCITRELLSKTELKALGNFCTVYDPLPYLATVFSKTRSERTLLIAMNLLSLLPEKDIDSLSSMLHMNIIHLFYSDFLPMVKLSASLYAYAIRNSSTKTRRVLQRAALYTSAIARVFANCLVSENLEERYTLLSSFLFMWAGYLEPIPFIRKILPNSLSEPLISSMNIFEPEKLDFFGQFSDIPLLPSMTALNPARRILEDHDDVYLYWMPDIRHSLAYALFNICELPSDRSWNFLDFTVKHKCLEGRPTLRGLYLDKLVEFPEMNMSEMKLFVLELWTKFISLSMLKEHEKEAIITLVSLTRILSKGHKMPFAFCEDLLTLNAVHPVYLPTSIKLLKVMNQVDDILANFNALFSLFTPFFDHPETLVDPVENSSFHSCWADFVLDLLQIFVAGLKCRNSLPPNATPLPVPQQLLTKQSNLDNIMRLVSYEFLPESIHQELSSTVLEILSLTCKTTEHIEWTAYSLSVILSMNVVNVDLWSSILLIIDQDLLSRFLPVPMANLLHHDRELFCKSMFGGIDEAYAQWSRSDLTTLHVKCMDSCDLITWHYDTDYCLRVGVYLAKLNQETFARLPQYLVQAVCKYLYEASLIELDETHIEALSCILKYYYEHGMLPPAAILKINYNLLVDNIELSPKSIFVLTYAACIIDELPAQIANTRLFGKLVAIYDKNGVSELLEALLKRVPELIPITVIPELYHAMTLRPLKVVEALTYLEPTHPLVPVIANHEVCMLIFTEYIKLTPNADILMTKWTQNPDFAAKFVSFFSQPWLDLTRFPDFSFASIAKSCLHHQLIVDVETRELLRDSFKSGVPASITPESGYHVSVLQRHPEFLTTLPTVAGMTKDMIISNIYSSITQPNYLQTLHGIYNTGYKETPTEHDLICLINACASYDLETLHLFRYVSTLIEVLPIDSTAEIAIKFAKEKPNNDTEKGIEARSHFWAALNGKNLDARHIVAGMYSILVSNTPTEDCRITRKTLAVEITGSFNDQCLDVLPGKGFVYRFLSFSTLHELKSLLNSATIEASCVYKPEYRATILSEILKYFDNPQNFKKTEEIPAYFHSIIDPSYLPILSGTFCGILSSHGAPIYGKFICENPKSLLTSICHSDNPKAYLLGAVLLRNLSSSEISLFFDAANLRAAINHEHSPELAMFLGEAAYSVIVSRDLYPLLKNMEAGHFTVSIMTQMLRHKELKASHIPSSWYDFARSEVEHKSEPCKICGYFLMATKSAPDLIISSMPKQPRFSLERYPALK